MQHAELRKTLTELFKGRPHLRSVFYILIDVLIVSFWHIRRGILAFARTRKGPVHVLDAGTGLGQYVYYLTRKFPNWNIYATDISSREICECNRFFHRLKYERVLFRTESLESLHRQEVYDLILAVNVIEYVDDDRLVLKNFYEALKPEGLLLMSMQSDKSQNIQPNFTNKLLGNRHVSHRYNNLEFKKMLKEIGFRDIKAHYAYGVSGRFSTFLGVTIPNKLLRRSKYYLYVLPLYYLICYPLIFLLNSIDAYFVHLSGSELVIRAYKH
ncbi:MAG: class I SAM-dependent methyltransferase [Bacteroidia bacterium]